MEKVDSPVKNTPPNMLVITEALATTMQKLVDCVNELKRLVRSQAIVDCQLYDIPKVYKEEENDKPDYIPVETHASPQILESLLGEMFDFYGKEDLSTKASQRVPGMIAIKMSDPDLDLLVAKVDRINELKNEFKKLAAQIPNKDIRFEKIHNLFPFLVTLNLYRTIWLFKNPQRLSFTWAKKKLINKVDAQALISKLQRVKEHLGKGEGWKALVEKEIDIIENIQNPLDLRFVRDVKAQPVVNIDGKTIACPIPILVVMTNDNVPEVEPLKTYDANTTKKGTGKVETQRKLLIERLDLYLNT